METTRIASINVRGLGNTQKMTQVFQWLNTLNFAIYFLQETHSTEITAKRWKNEWPGKCFFSGASWKSEGVVILIYCYWWKNYFVNYKCK